MTIQHFNTKLAAECREVTWRVLEIRKPRVLCPACEEVKHPENQWNISSCFIPQASTLAPSYLCPQRLRSRKSTLAKIVHRIAEFLRGYRYGQLTVEIASLSGWWTVGALVSASSVGALELDPTVGGWITTQFSVKLDHHLTKSRLKDAKSISLIAANFWNDDLVFWWTCSQMGAALGTRPTASSGHKLGAKPFSSKTWGLIFISSMLLESCRKLEKVLPMAGRGPKKHTHIVDISFQLFQYIGFQGWTSPPRRRFRCSNAFRLAPQYHAWNDLNGLSQVTWSTWIWREFCIFLLMILDDIWWYETTLKTY